MLTKNFKVFWAHDNKHGDGSVRKENIKNKVRSSTVCYIHPINADIKAVQPIGSGISFCSAVDNFWRAIGRKLSFNKAMKDLEGTVSKEEKQELWDAFIEQFPPKK